MLGAGQLSLMLYHCRANNKLTFSLSFATLVLLLSGMLVTCGIFMIILLNHITICVEETKKKDEKQIGAF